MSHDQSLRGRLSILTLAAVLSLLGSSKAQPSVKKWERDSSGVLKSLDALVAVSAKSKKCPSRRWDQIAEKRANQARCLVTAHKKNKPLQKYFRSQERAWRRVKSMGIKFIKMHHRLKTYTKELKQNNEYVRKAVYGFMTKIKKLDEPIGEIIENSGVIDELTDTLKPINSELRDVNSAWGRFKAIAYPIQVSYAKFRVNQDQFIKLRGKAREYKYKVDALKADKYVKEGGDLIKPFEKRWDEALVKAYLEYEDAVEEWDDLKDAYDEDQLAKMFKTSADGIVELGSTLLFGVTIPPFVTKDVNDVTNYIDRARRIWNRALKKDLSETWQEIAKAQYSLEEAKNEVQSQCRQDLKEMQQELGMKFGRIKEEVDTNIERLNNEIRVLDYRIRQLGDSPEVPKLVEERAEHYATISKEKLHEKTSRRHYLVTEKDKRARELYAQRDAKLKELKEKHRELDRKAKQYTQD